jgi:hypothetical protein
VCQRRSVSLTVTMETAGQLNDADWTYSLARDGAVVGWDGLVGADFSGGPSPALWLLQEYLSSFLTDLVIHGRQMSFDDLLDLDTLKAEGIACEP